MSFIPKQIGIVTEIFLTKSMKLFRFWGIKWNIIGTRWKPMVALFMVVLTTALQCDSIPIQKESNVSSAFFISMPGMFFLTVWLLATLKTSGNCNEPQFKHYISLLFERKTKQKFFKKSNKSAYLVVPGPIIIVLAQNRERTRKIT